MGDIRQLGIPEAEPALEPETDAEIIAALREENALLKAKVAEFHARLTDHRWMVSRAIKLLNGKRGLGLSFAVGLAAAYLFAVATPFNGALAGLVQRVFGGNEQAVSAPAPRTRVQPYPVIVYVDREIPSPSPSPGSASPPSPAPRQAGLIPPLVNLPTPPPTPRDPDEVADQLRKHCHTPPPVQLPRCSPSPSPLPSLPPAPQI